jgi:alkylated DNA repair dioxygenase AlkB
MTTLLKTATSALILHELDTNICHLIETCVRSIGEELDVNPAIIVYGKICHQHRSVGFYSDTSRGYNYSTSITPSKPMHPCLRELLEYINTTFNYNYNGILINRYINGEDYIGKHSDDERGLDDKVGVISMSYGAVRKFRIRNKITGKIEIDVPTDPTKIIQMVGNFQKEFTHEIPIEKKVKDVRYSLTFRKHYI